MSFLPNRIYGILKYVCIIVLPAIGCLYASLSAIWGLPFESEIPATIVAVETFFGAVLLISDANYKKGQGNDKG